MSSHAASNPGHRHESPFARRRAGVLLHPTSLPSGVLGVDAYRFVDWLAECGASLWQCLPLGPTHADRSPYQCLSVFAGNPELIDIDGLVASGWLSPEVTGSDRSHGELVREAYEGFGRHASDAQREELALYRAQQQYWLEDYCLYQALRLRHGHRSWLEWSPPLRDREPEALEQARGELADAMDFVVFEQFVFHRQWLALKQYANERGVLLFGDMPIFVAHDSAEVWGRRNYFTLDAHGQAETVAGVPPDYFSETGQLWGNPHYRWDRMQDDNFYWWHQRIAHQLELFDLIRIDHFRGFEAYWEIPAEAETAIEGHWVEAPGEQLFRSLQEEFDPLPLVAEDLGMITESVHRLRQRFGLPGMKILQFAFGGGPDNPYLPHNHERDYVVYTGTHDNNTTLGWYEGLTQEQRARVGDYLGVAEPVMPWSLVRQALASVAMLAVVPMQDVLGLGEEHRMNVPGTSEGNWSWRFRWGQLSQDSTSRMRHWIELYGRRPD